MKTHYLFLDDPLTDDELFPLLRENFNDDEDCWDAVREAQLAYADMTRTLVLDEMEEERMEKYFDERNSNAA
jgi:hypothetical protein